MYHTPQRVSDARIIKEARDASRWSNLIICRLDRCADIPSSTWRCTCRHIMAGLPLVIDYLCFFFFLSLMTIKVHIYPLFIYCLFQFGIVVKPK